MRALELGMCSDNTKNKEILQTKSSRRISFASAKDRRKPMKMNMRMIAQLAPPCTRLKTLHCPSFTRPVLPSRYHNVL